MALTFAVKLFLTMLDLNALSIYYLDQTLGTDISANMAEDSMI